MCVCIAPCTMFACSFVWCLAHPQDHRFWRGQVLGQAQRAHATVSRERLSHQQQVRQQVVVKSPLSVVALPATHERLSQLCILDIRCTSSVDCSLVPVAVYSCLFWIWILEPEFVDALLFRLWFHFGPDLELVILYMNDYRVHLIVKLQTIYVKFSLIIYAVTVSI